jgi:hypothetical protein
MGSPLGPLFANMFMSHFERKQMERMKELGLKTWMRFVDDINATVGDKGQVIVMCMFLNEQHPNIKFTIEHEVKNRLPFLDTCVIRAVDGYKTSLQEKDFHGCISQLEQPYSASIHNWSYKMLCRKDLENSQCHV